MDEERQSVRCDSCSELALGELDGVPLCEGCLLSALLSSTEPDVADRIKPLRERRAAG